MTLVVSNYNEVINNSKDPLVDTWPLMGSPAPVIIILGIYLAFVLKIGPSMMANRPAFTLTNTMIWYNAIQVVFSIALSTMALRTGFYKFIFMSTCSSQEAVHQDKGLQSKLLNAAWWYFFAKIIELLDTVFFVLRKKQNQVSFLHVYHHTITAFFSWCYLKLLPGEQGILLGFLNSSVHIIMYTYYMIAAMGPQYRKYLWWKKYVTTIQLVQFGLMFSYLMLVLAIDCTMSKALTYFFMTNVVIFIYLFSDFYRKSYSKKNQA